MAHFTEIDNDNVVLRVIVVSNADTANNEGVEIESIGAEFCRNLFGGRWVQTSYNNNFRKNFAAVGQKYDPVIDEFLVRKFVDDGFVFVKSLQNE